MLGAYRVVLGSSWSLTWGVLGCPACAVLGSSRQDGAKLAANESNPRILIDLILKGLRVELILNPRSF